MSSEEKKPGFEVMMQRLEDIVTQLEEGSLHLEESMSLFEEGYRLSLQCESQLEEFEQRVEVILKADETLEEGYIES